MRSSNFAFDCVHLLHYKCHKINPNCSGSRIDSSDMIKSKKAKQTLSMKEIINAFNTL